MSTMEVGSGLRPAVGAADVEGFAAGLGHELSNLVAALTIRLDCLVEECRGGRAAEDLEAMRGTLEKARRLSDGLRFLAADAGGGGLAEAASLRGWWAAMEPVLRAAAPRGVWLEGSIAGCEADVTVAPAPLTRIVFAVVGTVCRCLGAGPGGRVAVGVVAGEGRVEVSVSFEGGAAAGDGWVEELLGWVRRTGADAVMGCGAEGRRSITVGLGAIGSGAQAGPGRRVFVGVEDARTRALILAELGALACDATSDPMRRMGCDVEVVDASGTPRGRRVVLLAEGPAVGGADGAVRIGRNPSATTLREALRRAVREGC